VKSVIYEPDLKYLIVFYICLTLGAFLRMGNFMTTFYFPYFSKSREAALNM
jgi:hypothetical protein